MTIKGTLDDADARGHESCAQEVISTGPIGAVAQLEGHRRRRSSARRPQLDLTPATINLDLINYKKAAGVPASAQITARLDDAGNLRSEDVSLSGAGLAVRGTASVGPNGDLQHLDIPIAHLGPVNDFAFTMTRTPMPEVSISR